MEKTNGLDNSFATPKHHRSDKLITATFAGGSFWSLEAAFRRVPGVAATSVGYTGGHFPEPTYRDVCTNTTGHAEAVRLYFDPDYVNYRQLLKVFFNSHDPSSLNRQGADIGTRFRSAIFWHDQQQWIEAQILIHQLTNSGEFDGEIVTELVPVTKFYKAEQYHQQYYEKASLK